MWVRRGKEGVVLTGVFVWSGIFLLITIVFLMVTNMSLTRISIKDISGVYAAAGAVLEEYPELEGVLAEALKEGREDHVRRGRETLEKYGYKAGVPEEGLRTSIHEQRSLLWIWAALSFLSGGMVCTLFYMNFRFKSQEMERVLEEYLTREDGERIDMTGMGRLSDVLEQYGKRMKLSQQRAEEEKENIKSLITDISHQLKTPITSMRTCFEICQETEDKEEREEFGSRTLQQIEQLQRMAEVLIRLSRLETSMIELKPEVCRVQDLLVKAVNAIYPQAAVRKIGIVNSSDEKCEDIFVRADPGWTVEAMVNVLDNGIKYSPMGSTIDIQVHRLTTFVKIDIGDEGPGILGDEQAKVFKRFYRGSSPAVKGMGGSGIGLYLTRMILERQGGGIWLSQKEGRGSVFHLHLPFEK